MDNNMTQSTKTFKETLKEYSEKPEGDLNAVLLIDAKDLNNIVSVFGITFKTNPIILNLIASQFSFMVAHNMFEDFVACIPQAQLRQAIAIPDDKTVLHINKQNIKGG